MGEQNRAERTQIEPGLDRSVGDACAGARHSVGPDQPKLSTTAQLGSSPRPTSFLRRLPTRRSRAMSPYLAEMADWTSS